MSPKKYSKAFCLLPCVSIMGSQRRLGTYIYSKLVPTYGLVPPFSRVLFIIPTSTPFLCCGGGPPSLRIASKEGEGRKKGIRSQREKEEKARVELLYLFRSGVEGEAHKTQNEGAGGALLWRRP